MRLAVLYYLAQTQNADRHRQAQRDKQACATSQPRHRRTPWLTYRALILPAALKRRVLTTRGQGTAAPSTAAARGLGLKTESYWEKDLSEAEWKAIFAEAFGPDAVTDWDA